MVICSIDRKNTYGSGINKCKQESVEKPKESQNSKLFSIAEIDSCLLLSGASMITDSSLSKLGVTCVVSACPELPAVPLPPAVLHHYNIDIRDNPDSDLGEHFDKVADIIHQVDRRGGRTLVHCVAGVSRSASLCLAYLLKYRKMSLRDAYKHVQSQRPCVRPNCGFFRQLIEYEKKQTGSTTVDMIYNSGAKGVIPDLYLTEYANTVRYIDRFIGTK